jgi:hypothetical protein
MSIINFNSLKAFGRMLTTSFDGMNDLVSINVDSAVKLSRAGNNVAGVAEDATASWRETALLQLKRDHQLKVAEFDLPPN